MPVVKGQLMGLATAAAAFNLLWSVNNDKIFIAVRL